jgi:hypothetical protein
LRYTKGASLSASVDSLARAIGTLFTGAAVIKGCF